MSANAINTAIITFALVVISMLIYKRVITDNTKHENSKV